MSRRLGLLVLCLVALVSAGAAPGRADAGPTQLPFPFMVNSGPWLAVDPVGDHVFVSGGTSSIVVLDFSGHIVTTITGEPGASQMVVDPATHTLYVALPGANAIGEIDTRTLTETGRVSTYVDPTGLVLAGGKVWFTGGSAPGPFVGSMNLDGSGVTYSALGLLEPVFLASGGPGQGLLAMVSSTVEPPTLSVYDVSSGSPSLVKSVIEGSFGFVPQMVFDRPEGANLLLAAGSVWSLSASTFAPNFKYFVFAGEGGSTGEAVTADGNYIAANADAPFPSEPNVAVFQRGDPTAIEGWHVASSVPYHSLAFSPDGTKLFVVANNAQTEQLEFDVLDALPSTTISTHPDATTDSTDAEFVFGSDESGATFECAVDGGTYSPCTSPANYSGLGVGDHTFSVEASSNGVTGPAASYDWIVERHTLTVTKTGAGGAAGIVTSSPGGIDCGSTCSHDFAPGTSVTLTAVGPMHDTFQGWSGGGCSGTAACTVTMTHAITVTADFEPHLPIPGCVVPEVKGRSLKAAKAAIEAHNCRVGRIERLFSRNVKKGHVISEKPRPRMRLALHSKIRLSVSRGRRR